MLYAHALLVEENVPEAAIRRNALRGLSAGIPAVGTMHEDPEHMRERPDVTMARHKAAHVASIRRNDCV